MPPFAQKNPRFRPRKQIAKDTLVVLNTDISYGCKYGVLYQVTWEWTEIDGKVKGMKFWSRDAFEQYIENEYSDFGLRHEHVVPRKVIIEYLLSIDKSLLSEEFLFEYFNKYLIGCVVTSGEAENLDSRYKSNMPPEFYEVGGSGYQDRWLRYKYLGIKVYEVIWDDKKRNKDIDCIYHMIY